MHLLTVDDQRTKLNLALDHMHWILDDCKKVTCFDVSRFQMLRTDDGGRQEIQPYYSVDSTSQQDIVQADDGSIIVWIGSFFK